MTTSPNSTAAPGARGASSASPSRAAGSARGKSPLAIAYLREDQVAGQPGAGGVERRQQVADDGEGADLVEAGLVVEDQAVVEDGGGDGLDVLEADGGPARQQGDGPPGFGQSDGRPGGGAV